MNTESRRYRVSLGVEIEVLAVSHEQALEEGEMLLRAALEEAGFSGRLAIRPTGSSWLDALT